MANLVILQEETFNSAGDETEVLKGENTYTESIGRDWIGIAFHDEWTGTVLLIADTSNIEGNTLGGEINAHAFTYNENQEIYHVEVLAGVDYKLKADTDFVGTLPVQIFTGARKVVER